MRKLISLFIILTFVASVGLLGEVESIMEKDSALARYETSTVALDLNLNFDYSDCEENGCHQAGSHCSHHCSGGHITSISSKTTNLDSLKTQINKLQWYFINHYKTPSLAPFLKPPLQS